MKIDRPPIPVSNEPDIEKHNGKNIEELLNMEGWKCPSCGLTNFGANEHCADYRCREVKPNND